MPFGVAGDQSNGRALIPYAAMAPLLLITWLFSDKAPKPGMDTSGKVTADPLFP